MSLEMNALFRRYADENAKFDYESATSEQARDQNKRDRKIELDRNLDNSAGNFATRGMTHSGARLKHDVDLKKDRTRADSDDDQAYNTLMTKLARNRLASTNQYRQDKSILDLQELIGN